MMKLCFFTILTNEALTASVYRMTLSGDTSAITAPGQFVNIRLAGKFLRRPISVCDWEDGKLTLVYKVVGHGTARATIAYRDKGGALPLIRRFYQLGFNIEATTGTAKFLKEHGIRTHALQKISDGSEEIPNALRQGHIAYVINTRDPGANENDGIKIRQIATEHNVTLFTALDTIKVLLDVLEETTLTISTIDS